MYVVGITTDTIYQYSTAAAAPVEWTDPDLANALYDSVSFSVAGQESTPQSVFFKPDGTKVYVAGNTGNDINEYDLSTAWDASSATFVQNFSVGTQEPTPQGVVFKPDGTKMYVTGSSVGGRVHEYNLSTAWDISTAAYLQTLDVSSFQSIATGLFFKTDGTKLFTVGRSSDDVNEFSLSTAWDISSASHVQNFSVATQEAEPSDLYFSPDGNHMFIIGYSGVDVNEYDLSTAWDISTAVYSENFSVASQETLPLGLFFKPDGSKMYIVGQATDTIYQYSTA